MAVEGKTQKYTESLRIKIQLPTRAVVIVVKDLACHIEYFCGSAYSSEWISLLSLPKIYFFQF